MNLIDGFMADVLAGRPVSEGPRQPDALRLAAADYAGLGFNPIPLHGKLPACAGWSSMPVPLQWAQAGNVGNLGLRAGDGIAFIDLDEKNKPGSVAAGVRYLGSLGYYEDMFPMTRTPSGGAHIYVSWRGGIPGHWRTLASDFAAGEFRFGPGAYVAAPPTVIDGKPYELIAGDYRQLPRLEVDDVLPILQNKDVGQPDDVAAAILATAGNGETGLISKRTWRLLRGEGVDRYPSRSEHEAATVAGLVNAGLSFAAILGLFQTWPCAGKFTELYRVNPNGAIRYLRLTWEKVSKWTASHASEGRKAAFLAILAAQDRPWPGATGRSDHACFLAHGLTAFQCGKLEYGLSLRQLAEGMGCTQITAHNANKRILADGLIVRVPGARALEATHWRLVNEKGSETKASPSHAGNVKDLLHSRSIPPFAADAFRARGLGKTCAELWALLREQPMTGRELADRSGRHIKTVRDNLKKMWGGLVDPTTGEVLRLVELDADKRTWRAVEADLEAVARAVGTAGAGERQKAIHAEQRAGKTRAILRQQAGDVPARVVGKAQREKSAGRIKRITAIAEAEAHGKEDLPVWDEVLERWREFEAARAAVVN